MADILGHPGDGAAGRTVFVIESCPVRCRARALGRLGPRPVPGVPVPDVTEVAVLVVSRFRTDPGDDAGFLERAREALAAFAGRPGFLRGRVGRATDDPGAWVLVTEWEGVGAYRRSLSSYEVKVSATPLLATALPEAGAFEVLLAADSAAAPTARRSGRARDADEVRVGEAAGPDVPVAGQ